MKKTLPVRPFLTSRVISARASSTSARTSVDTWVVASLIRSPIDGSAGPAWGSASGIVVSVLGTPFLRSTLLTDGPLVSTARLLLGAVSSPASYPGRWQARLSSRFMLPCAAVAHEASRIPADRGQSE